MSDIPTRDSFPSNQEPKKDETTEPGKQKLQPVTNSAVQRKPSIIRRVKSAFIADDARSIGSFLLEDVVIPTAKSLISDVVKRDRASTLWRVSRAPHVEFSDLYARLHTLQSSL